MPGGSSHSCPHGEEAQGVEDPLTYRQAPLILTTFIACPNSIYKAESARLGTSRWKARQISRVGQNTIGEMTRGVSYLVEAEADTGKKYTRSVSCSTVTILVASVELLVNDEDPPASAGIPRRTCRQCSKSARLALSNATYQARLITGQDICGYEMDRRVDTIPRLGINKSTRISLTRSSSLSPSVLR